MEESNKENKEKEVNVPVKYNPETGKYEADSEEMNKKLQEMNKENISDASDQEQAQSENIKQEKEEPIQKDNQKSLKKEEPKEKPKPKKKKKEGSFKPMILIMVFSLIIAGLWDQIPAIKNSIHSFLDPTAGVLLSWNMHWGMLVIILFITIITTLVQKYGTDQETLRELKKEQKALQKEMKDNKQNQQKMMELQKKQMKLMPKQMKLSMRGIIYTGVPFILLVRWFHDYFEAAGNPEFFGFMGWIWFYLLGALIVGAILRKWWDVV